MADHPSVILDNARHHLDEMLTNVAHHLKGEHEKSQQLQRERAELGVQLSRAEERKESLIRELQAATARLPKCDTRPTEERTRTDDHDLKCRHRCNNVITLERKLQRVKDARLQTISQAWHKARLLREQDEQLLNLRDAMFCKSIPTT